MHWATEANNDRRLNHTHKKSKPSRKEFFFPPKKYEEKNRFLLGKKKIKSNQIVLLVLWCRRWCCCDDFLSHPVAIHTCHTLDSILVHVATVLLPMQRTHNIFFLIFAYNNHRQSQWCVASIMRNGKSINFINQTHTTHNSFSICLASFRSKKY